MFKNIPAYSSFSVDKIENVKNFYENILGVEIEDGVQMTMELLTLKLSNGGRVMIYPKGEGHTPATFTVLNFEVDNIQDAVKELKEKGVVFEHYDGGYIKMNDDNIALDDHDKPYIAWFKDPAGNILSVVEKR